MNTNTEPQTISKILRLGMISILVVFLFGLSVQPVQSLMAGYSLTWSVWISAPVKLVVCWENPSAAEPYDGEVDQTSGATRREWARLAVKNSWERHARVIFIGWEPCQDELNPEDPPHTLGPRRPGTLDENLKVNISYSGASNNWGHGSWGDYQQQGVTINLHCGAYPNLKSCIEYLAIHEFGHTLGYYHEEERDDWPTNIPGCPKQTHAPADPWWPIPTEMDFGAPDPTSVMAYCSGWPTNLSPRDITGAQHLYTRRIPGTMLSIPGSLCLSGHANEANGSGTFGWDCDEANNDQEWIYDRSNYSLSIVWPGDPQQKQRCLDVDTNTYSKVQIWDCHYGQNQQWLFRNVELRGYGGLCLTRPDQGIGPVTIQTCTGTTKQSWQLEPGGLSNTFNIKSDTGDLCLEASNIVGSAFEVDFCSPSKVFLPLITRGGGTLTAWFTQQNLNSLAVVPQQTRDFYLLPGGQLGIPNEGGSSLCMDVVDVLDSDYLNGLGGPVSGQTVQAFTCLAGQYNQRWNLSGNVISGEKCLTVTGNLTKNGAIAAVTSCNGSNEQTWDYYW